MLIHLLGGELGAYFNGEEPSQSCLLILLLSGIGITHRFFFGVGDMMGFTA